LIARLDELLPAIAREAAPEDASLLAEIVAAIIGQSDRRARACGRAPAHATVTQRCYAELLIGLLIGATSHQESRRKLPENGVIHAL
jgi:hypothetical protein